MLLDIPREILQDPAQALELEWLDSNALGGWASSSVLGCNTRTYHGILVAAVIPPTDRKVMLSRLDESILINAESISLATRDFGDILYPQGFNFLTSFQQACFPCWEFQVGKHRIKKSLLCHQNSNSVCIRYELVAGESSLPISFEPFIAARDYHSSQHFDASINQAYDFTKQTLILSPKSNLPNIQIIGPWEKYSHSPSWHYRFFYREEANRGLADREDLLCIGKLECLLSKESPLTIVVSSDSISGNSPAQRYEDELQKREAISVRVKTLSSCTKAQTLLEPLLLAAEQFIVQRGQGKTILAGYHWFTDWGRDTLIAIRGLCIATGKLSEAQAIFQVFCDSVQDGLVPNRFVEAGESAEYNTVDASLWLFVAAYEFYEAGGDKVFVRQVLLPTLTKIFEAYSKGTRFQIKEDNDGLISAGNPQIQLTWMDAKIGDWVVTPRHGKAVEINALWFNALNILGILAEFCDKTSLAKLAREKALQTQSAFNNTFWNDTAGCLYDIVRADFSDPSIRPNQIFAVGLPFPILSPEKSRSIIKVVREHLLTPRGLRTLSPLDPCYRSHYSGSPYERDSAYHQGTVWPWLLGAYMDALLSCDPKNGRIEARQILDNMCSHLYEAGLGTISEIFDGDSPHKPKGSIAQAWSVSELLRLCLRMLV